MKNIALTTALASAFLLAGCKGENGTTPPLTPLAESEVIAKVNGKPITKASLQTLSEEIEQRAPGMEIPREQLIEELIQRELLVQDAESKALAQKPEIIAQVDAARRSILSQAAIEDFFNSSEVTDEQVRQEYDQRIGSTQKTEYKARHILMKTANDAKDVIKKLKAGGDFSELAKKHSTDSAAATGGDLGWFSPQQMVEPFANAVMALKDGEYSQEPVETQFGWHVILREDAREQAPPPFEAVQQQIRQVLQREKLQQYLSGLRAQAQVEMLETPSPAPAAPEPAVEAPPAAEPAVEAEQTEETENQ